jgi:hypothetical protein
MCILKPSARIIPIARHDAGSDALSGKLGIQRWRYCHLTNINPEPKIATCDMSSVPKSVLIVSQDDMLRTTRAALLKTGGYEVTAVASDNEAMALLETRTFDLVLVGRKTDLPIIEIDERLRTRHPKLLVLKIEDLEESAGGFADRKTDSNPEHVLLALKQMLGPSF